MLNVKSKWEMYYMKSKKLMSSNLKNGPSYVCKLLSPTKTKDV